MNGLNAEYISAELAEVSALLEVLAIYAGEATGNRPPAIDVVYGETLRAAFYGVSNYVERIASDVTSYGEQQDDMIFLLKKKLQDQAEKLPTKDQEEAPTKEGTAEREMKSATKASASALTEG